MFSSQILGRIFSAQRLRSTRRLDHRPTFRERAMSDNDIDDLKPETVSKPKIEQPRMYKVVLLNDDYTPREFVVQVLKAVFRTNEDQAYRIMMTAHQRGVCVVATFTRDVAESKAKEGTDMGRQKGYPLMFSTEPEE